MADLLNAGALNRLDPADRARAQRLATGVLRNLERVDNVLKKHLSKPPPLPVRNILRLGAYEMATGAAAHGVVNDLVAIASKDRRHGRLKGLVNAVLRKLVSVSDEWADLPIPKLPKWLRNPLIEAWGQAAVHKMERAHAVGAPLDLTEQRPTEGLHGDLLPTGSLRLEGRLQVSALPGFEAGHWWVQDAAAAIPAQLVDGQNVLDLCSAPGGKTLQLAAAGKTVTSVDISEKRLRRLQANLDRTGLEADVVISDALALRGHWDAVLLDAPCSATGTIRRHPDLPHAKDGSDFLALFDLQKRLLDHAVSLVKPGGQIVFCTCSLLPDEGEVHIEDALKTHASLQIDTAALDKPWIEPAWRSPEGGLRLRPDFWLERGGMDGFYIAALRKRAD